MFKVGDKGKTCGWVVICEYAPDGFRDALFFPFRSQAVESIAKDDRSLVRPVALIPVSLEYTDGQGLDTPTE